MKIIYTTLNNIEEAKNISKILLEKRFANCTNFFPITCMYNYENEITEEPEVVLIIKTSNNKYSEIESVIKSSIDYDNFIGELDIANVNSNFTEWLSNIVN